MRKTPTGPLAITLLALLIIGVPTTAAEIGLSGFELRAGVTSPDAFDTGLSVGANLDLGEVYDQLRLYPGLFYSTASTDFFGEDLDVDVLAAGAEVRYFLEPDLSGWYFGGGPYLHDYSYSISGVDLGGASTVGVVGVAGYNFDPLLGIEGRFNTGFQHFAILATFRFGGDGP